ncbi:MAG: hypothetical protein U0746_03000 [Gemmataceae bacterium]
MHDSSFDELLDALAKIRKANLDILLKEYGAVASIAGQALKLRIERYMKSIASSDPELAARCREDLKALLAPSEEGQDRPLPRMSETFSDESSNSQAISHLDLPLPSTVPSDNGRPTNPTHPAETRRAGRPLGSRDSQPRKRRPTTDGDNGTTN